MQRLLYVEISVADGLAKTYPVQLAANSRIVRSRTDFSNKLINVEYNSATSM